MKVLIVNKFFYPRGGDCIVAMSTRRLLQSQGHEVRVFSMTHPDNAELPESGSFAPAVDFSGGIPQKLRGVSRVLGGAGVKNAFRKVLDDFRPDVVHFHNIHSYLSPSIVEEAHRCGIRTVWTLHDYKLICPAYACLRPDGTVCSECIATPSAVSLHRCMKGSRVQSKLAELEKKKYNPSRLAAATDLFIAPSRFMKEMMEKGGYPAGKIVEICNFIDPDKEAVYAASDAGSGRGDYFCYVGRLSREKGLETLMEAARKSGVEMKIAGDGPLAQDLKEKYGAVPGISFLGKLNAAEVAQLLLGAKASVIPSQWYENNPLGVIESLCAGTPVIGSDMGGIPELIDGGAGEIFPYGDSVALARILKDFKALTPEQHRDLAVSQRERFSRDIHLRKLLEAYGVQS